MENKVSNEKKQKLIQRLSPRQREYLEAFDWFYNGGRGSGRTYLSCTVALLGLLNGQHQVFIQDHTPYHEGMKSYIGNIIHSMADDIELAVQTKEVRGGIMVALAPDYVQYEYDKKKNENKRQ